MLCRGLVPVRAATGRERWPKAAIALVATARCLCRGHFLPNAVILIEREGPAFHFDESVPVRVRARFQPKSCLGRSKYRTAVGRRAALAKRHSSLDGLPIVSRDASIKRPSFAPHPTYNGTAPRRITRFAGVRLMDFEILGNVSTIEPIAVGRGIRDRSRLQRLYGKGRWRKLRGIATVRLSDGTIHTAEVHWYEAHGIGRREFKLKFPLLD